MICHITDFKDRIKKICYTKNVLRETILLEHENVGHYTLGGGGLKKWTVVHSWKCWHLLMAPKYIAYFIVHQMISYFLNLFMFLPWGYYLVKFGI